MAYDDPIDPDTPADGDMISEGDDRIRELKRALISRLMTIIQNIDDDPLKFVDGIVNRDAIADSAIDSTKLDSGIQLRSILLGSASVNTSLAPGATYVHDFTVTGAEPGDVVVLSWIGASHAFITYHAWVSANDTVTVTIGSLEGGTVGVVGDLQITIIKASMLATDA